MKILLDECVHYKMVDLLSDHTVKTVVQSGWEGVKNGKLLKLASNNFDAFITVDRNLAFQQNPKILPLPILIIHSPTTLITDLKKFVPDILKTLQQPLSNKFYHLAV